MENTSEEAKQRAKNYMSLKGALEPKETLKNKPMATKELMDFINFLDNRGLLSIPIEKHDYEKTIWEYEKTINPSTTEPKPNNHINIGGCF
jgi:hypothetical protein